MTLLLLALGCAAPLTLPDDPAEPGVPVGLRTVEYREQTLAVFYPADDAAASMPEHEADLADWVPPVFFDHLGVPDLPPVTVAAVRDAPVRQARDPYPVLLFSHGFGGFRLQSHSLATHLASRGYVVVAPDHPGRTLGDLLPCMFSPPLDGCDLSGTTGGDPGPDDLDDAADWAGGEHFLTGAVAAAPYGTFGHSAGGGSVVTHAGDDTRVGAVFSMAAATERARDIPTVLSSGTCDGVVPDAGTVDAWESGGGTLVRLQDAGHMAFADICELDLVAFADEWLAGRDDINGVFLDALVALAGDGCPDRAPSDDLPECGDTYLDLEVSEHALRHLLTVFFDQALLDTGPGIEAGVLAEVEVR